MDKRLLLFIVSLSLALFGIRYGFNYYYAEEHKEWLEKKAQNIQPAPQKQESEEVVEEFAPAENLSSAKYYVLENDYQQLVFCNIGGSIVEINLPFKSTQHPQSPVLPIEFDKELKKQTPVNAAFPLNLAQNYEGTRIEPQEGGYYPLLRRSQYVHGEEKTPPPALWACNIVSEYPEVAKTVYRVKSFTKNEIVFESESGRRHITKRFRLPEDPDAIPYCLFLNMRIDGPGRNVWLTSGVPEVEWISANSGATIKYRVVRNQKSSVEKIDLPKTTFNLSSLSPDWVCNSNGFFGIIVDPLQGFDNGFRADFIDGNVIPSKLTLIDTDYGRFQPKDLPGYNVLMPLQPQTTIEARIFAGPFAEKVLKKVDAFFSEEQGGKSSEYLLTQTFHGWFAFISEPFAQFLFFLMKIFYDLFGSWALSIILVTVVLRILLYPLNTWSMRSMKRMQQIAPKVKAIQDRYKKEPQKAQMEIMALYREQKVNPVSGCLPLLLQMPFLIGMFDLLKSSFELRGASFIPGWIDDLSAPDVLFSWKTQLPLIGNEFHLLPILLGVIMYLQQHFQNPLPKNPAEWTDQQKQQRFMGNIMTIMMAVLFYNFPSGLNIYWISSMLLGIIQQWWTNRTVQEPVKEKKQ